MFGNLPASGILTPNISPTLADFRPADPLFHVELHFECYFKIRL
jgi:hypothetical protein